MTLGAQTAALGLLIAVAACSIQDDVPGFTYPASTLTGTPAEKPVLQPTGALIVDTSADAETYNRTTAGLDARARLLRDAVSEPADP